MTCASPSASFSSVLLSRICSAAFTRLASRHSTLRPALRRPCTSQGVIEPVSMPTLASTPACCEMRAEIGPGSVVQTPRQSRLPCSFTTQIAVVFCDTSSPFATRPVRHNVTSQISDGASHRATAPGSRHYRRLAPRSAITRGPHKPLAQLVRQPPRRDRRPAAAGNLGTQTRQRPAAIVAHIVGQDRRRDRPGMQPDLGLLSWPLAPPQPRHRPPAFTLLCAFLPCPRPPPPPPPPARRKVPPPVAHRTDMHPQNRGDLPGAPSLQRQQDRPRPIRFAAVLRFRQVTQYRLFRSVRRELRSSRYL